MNVTEERVDVRTLSEEDTKDVNRTAEYCFKINQTMPGSPEYNAFVKELFGDNIGEERDRCSSFGGDKGCT